MCGDVDRDGDADLVLLGGNNAAQYYANADGLGNLTLLNGTVFTDGDVPLESMNWKRGYLFDADGDGDLDIYYVFRTSASGGTAR